MKIALIIPYFGTWPDWFDLYLYSCKMNSKIDFLYYTDCPIPEKVYKNTIFQSISFNDYCKRVSDVLKINFYPNNPRKLCDLKPFYGIIHERELQNYDFWGFADIDLIYGNMDFFVNEKILKKYDFITSHSTHVSGHFSIMRVQSKYTRLPLKIKGWKSVLQDPNNKVFDEGDFSAKVFPLLRCFRFVYFHFLKFFGFDIFEVHQKFIDSIKFLYPKILFKECYSTLPLRKGVKWIYNLRSGKITAPVKELGIPKDLGCVYLHFFLFKKNSTGYVGDVTWPDNMYKLSRPLDYSKNIVIDSTGIHYED